jgi:hypothetical protein
MKEAKIILPVYPERMSMGEATKLHGHLQKRLATTFGGFTATEGDGGWIDDAGKLITERVRVYVVANQGDEGEAAKLRNIARWLAKESGEDCIYIRYADGEVELMSRSTELALSRH